MERLHDGCIGCEYDDLACTDFPCIACKQNHMEGEGDYPDLWKESDQNDAVNHPSHYCQDGSMECIDEMIEVFGEENVKAFCVLNVWKYRKRAMFKNGKEDLKKADWYMNKFKELNRKD